jgi:hypothetical protein
MWERTILVLAYNQILIVQPTANLFARRDISVYLFIMVYATILLMSNNV